MPPDCCTCTVHTSDSSLCRRMKPCKLCACPVPLEAFLESKTTRDDTLICKACKQACASIVDKQACSLTEIKEHIRHHGGPMAVAAHFERHGTLDSKTSPSKDPCSAALDVPAEYQSLENKEIGAEAKCRQLLAKSKVRKACKHGKRDRQYTAGPSKLSQVQCCSAPSRFPSRCFDWTHVHQTSGTPAAKCTAGCPQSQRVNTLSVLEC